MVGDKIQRQRRAAMCKKALTIPLRLAQCPQYCSQLTKGQQQEPELRISHGLLLGEFTYPA